MFKINRWMMFKSIISKLIRPWAWFKTTPKIKETNGKYSD
jgi:hypothetical protein